MIYSFQNILGMTFTGSILFLIISVATPITKRLFSPKWNCYSRCAILLFFLLPVGIAAAKLFESIANILVISGEANLANLWDDIPAPLTLTIPNTQAQVNPAHESIFELVLPFLPYIWIIGAVLSLLLRLLQLYRFERIIAKSNTQITDSAILTSFETAKKELNISNHITLYLNTGVTTPMLIGLIHTRLILPQIDLNDKELALVFRHELTHYRHHDLWIKTVAMLTCAVHWFNPCVYLLRNSIDKFLEMLCDSAIVSNMDYEQRRTYGATILEVLGRADNTQPSIYAAFSSNKRTMKERLSIMLNGKKPSKKTTAISIFVLIVIFIAGISVSASAHQNTIEAEALTLAPINITPDEHGNPNPLDYVEIERPKTQRNTEMATYTPKDSTSSPLNYIEIEQSKARYSVKLNVLLPDVDEDISIRARTNDILVAEATINPSKEGMLYWTPTIYSDESGKITVQIYLNKRLYQTITAETTESIVPKTTDESDIPYPRDFQAGTQPEFDSFLWPTKDGVIAENLASYHGHTGIDIKVALDTPVYASAPGIVVKVKESNVGYGNHIIIDHGNGYQTLYAHCNSLDIAVGDTVEAGQTIATVGRSGNTSRYNVHFEIRRDGKILNPEDYVNIDNTPVIVDKSPVKLP